MDQEIIVLDHDLIETVRQHPEIYLQETHKNALIWDGIARKMNIESEICQSKWLEIQYNYAKIKDLIRDRWDLESVLQVHPKTRMYLDGSLNFLDPYISGNSIPIYIHQRYKWVNSYLNDNKVYDNNNGLTLVTQGQVQAELAKRIKDEHLDTPNMKYLMEMVEATIAECIMRLKRNKEKFKATDSAHKNFLTIQSQLDQLSVEQESNCDSDMVDPLGENVVDNYEYIENTPINNIASEVEKNKTLETLVTPPDDLEVKEEVVAGENITDIKSEDSNESILNETDLKTYFNDLVLFVADNFTLEKQKKLQSRVTQLVREMLEDNDSE